MQYERKITEIVYFKNHHHMFLLLKKVRNLPENKKFFKRIVLTGTLECVCVVGLYNFCLIKKFSAWGAGKVSSVFFLSVIQSIEEFLCLMLMLRAQILWL